MINRVEMKEKAKQVFTGRYWLLVGIFAIIMAITGGAVGISSAGSSVSSGFSGTMADSGMSQETAIALVIIIAAFSLICSGVAILISIFGTNVLQLGGNRVSLNAMRGEHYAIKDIFCGFNKQRYFKNVGGMALYTLFIALPVIIVIIPAEVFLVLFAVLLSTRMPVWAFVILYIFLTTIVVTAAIIPGLIVQYGLSRVPYLLVDEDIRPMDAIKKSWRIMVGHKNEYFMLRLSFLGWSLLNVVTWGVTGVFWSTPYMNLTMAEYHDRVMAIEEPEEYPEVVE